MTPSLATQIRDAAYSRLVKAMGAQFKETRKTPILPLQPDQVPALGVFLIRDSMDPDGDPRTGPPRFIATLQLGISIAVVLPTSDDDYGCDALIDQALDTLLKDGTFVALVDATGAPLMEGIGGVVRTYNFPKDGEAFYMEGRLQMTCLYRCFFDPNAPNEFEQVNVTVRPFQPVLGETNASLEIDLPGS